MMQTRSNRKRSVDQLDSLAHADETNPPPLVYRIDIKSDSSVLDGELNFSGHSTELYVEVRNLTMFRRIVQCFLQNAVQAKGNLG